MATKFVEISLLEREITLFETENECQKTEPVPLPLPRASRNFPKKQETKSKKKIIIGHQRLSHLFVLVSRWTGTRIFFELSKLAFFIVIPLCYNELWLVCH